MKHTNANETAVRQEISVLIDNYHQHSRHSSLRMLAEKADIRQDAMSRLHNEHGDVSLNSICKLLNFLGYELVIHRKDL